MPPITTTTTQPSPPPPPPPHYQPLFVQFTKSPLWPARGRSPKIISQLPQIYLRPSQPNSHSWSLIKIFLGNKLLGEPAPQIYFHLRSLDATFLARHRLRLCFKKRNSFIFSSWYPSPPHSWPKMSSLIKGFPSCLALAHHKSQSKKNSKIIGFFLVQRNESPKNGAFFQEWIRGGEHLCQGLHASLFIHCILPNTITIHRGHHHYHQSIAVMIDIVISWNILYWYPGLGGWHDLLSGRRPHPDDGKPCGPGNILYFHIHNFHISRF